MRVRFGIAALVAGWLFAGGPEPVWQGGGATHLGGPSADGSRVTGIDPATGALLVKDLMTGAERRLTTPSDTGEFAYFSVLSRDGSQAAYAWFNRDRFYELRTVGTDGGGTPRILVRNEEAGFIQPCSFSPDGKQILTLLFRKDNVSQISLIATDDGSVRVLKSLNWVYPKRMDFSPDGKTIVYDNFAADGATQRDIFLLPIDGGPERRLVESPADDQFPVFSADGEWVFFSSDRPHGDEGAEARLWSVRLRDGKTEMIREGLGRFLVLGLSGPDRLLYATRTGGSFVYQAGINLANGKLTTAPAKMGEGTAVAWSADGKKMAWLGRRSSENFGTDARFVAVFEAGKEKVQTLTPKLAHIERLAWGEHGELFASGSDGKGRGGLFRLDGENITAVAREPGAPHTGYPAAGGYMAKGREVYRGTVKVGAGEGDVEALAASLDGKRFAYSDGKHIVCGDERFEVAGPVRAMAFAPSGDLVLIQGDEIWLQRMSGERTRIARASMAIDSIGLSPDGGTMLFAAGRPTTAVWAVGLP
ncbi:MAG: hypothetical protein R2729_14530 [Bryobacteraceae bacterium]